MEISRQKFICDVFSGESYNKTSHLPCNTWPRKRIFSVPVCRSNQQQNTFTRQGTFQCVIFTVFCYLVYIATEHNNTFAKKFVYSKNVEFIYCSVYRTLVIQNEMWKHITRDMISCGKMRVHLGCDFPCESSVNM